MASWIMHLRVGDPLRFSERIDPLCFAFGLVAPDCGLLRADGSYDPPKEHTHYGHSAARDYARFAAENLARGQEDKRYSFLLGCYAHIVTDAAWVARVLTPARAANCARDAAALRAEWDAHDARFLRAHGEPALLTLLSAAPAMPEVGDTYLPRAALADKFLRLRAQAETPLPVTPPCLVSCASVDAFAERLSEELARGLTASREVKTTWDFT